MDLSEQHKLSTPETAKYLGISTSTFPRTERAQTGRQPAERGWAMSALRADDRNQRCCAMSERDSEIIPLKRQASTPREVGMARRPADRRTGN